MKASSPALPLAALFLASLYLTSFASDAYGQEAQRSSYTPPEPLVTAPARYPRIAGENGYEGWVLVSFIINAEGNVQEAVIDDASNATMFGDAALEAVRNYRFSPAMENGEPVESSINRYLLRFNFYGGTQGARRSFRNTYNGILAMIEAGELEDATARIETLRSESTTNHYENAWLAWLHFQVLNATSDSSAELKINALSQAVMTHTSETGNRVASYLPADDYLLAMQELVNLLLGNGGLARALNVINEFSGNTGIRRHPNYQLFTDAFMNIESMVAEIAASDQVFRFNSAIPAGNYRVHDLLRRSFLLDPASGNIESIDIRCDNGRRQLFGYEENFQFTIPADWGACSLYFKGEPGDQIVLYEYNAP